LHLSETFRDVCHREAWEKEQNIQAGIHEIEGRGFNCGTRRGSGTKPWGRQGARGGKGSVVFNEKGSSPGWAEWGETTYEHSWSRGVTMMRQKKNNQSRRTSIIHEKRGEELEGERFAGRNGGGWGFREG